MPHGLSSSNLAHTFPILIWEYKPAFQSSLQSTMRKVTTLKQHGMPAQVSDLCCWPAFLAALSLWDWLGKYPGSFRRCLRISSQRFGSASSWWGFHLHLDLFAPCTRPSSSDFNAIGYLLS